MKTGHGGHRIWPQGGKDPAIGIETTEMVVPAVAKLLGNMKITASRQNYREEDDEEEEETAQSSSGKLTLQSDKPRIGN